MTQMESVTAREFNRSPSKIKRRAADHPVLITDHDEPSVVLLPFEQYERLVGTPEDLATWLEMDDDVDLVTEPLTIGLRPAEL
jgi:prevent-host-death family protein